MSRIALLSDIHANRHALEAVLQEVEHLGVDKAVCLGDTVGYGAYPGECVRLLRSHGICGVLGNHDFYALQLAKEPLDEEVAGGLLAHPVWGPLVLACEQLDDDDWQWLVEQSDTLTEAGAVLSHATLHERPEWRYLDDDHEVAATLAELSTHDSRTGFFGHTHVFSIFHLPQDSGKVTECGPCQWHLPEDAPCATTVASVGQPRSANSRASFAIWDESTRILEHHEVDYDAKKAAAAIVRAGLCHHNARRLLFRGR